MEFQADDPVKIKSGGPLMTVEKVGKSAMTDEEAVWCTWFDKVGNRQVVQRDAFAPVLLEMASRGIGGVSLGRG